ncbi:hypothetical protein COT94_04290 [Candidatus Falkowbacteria bacterium CG10_big_fil_rev_8_21_14_0_10_37_14]|uniref:Glycosyltransferase family 1 protein n=1 Tax=Candidatus Falkowbacteria bacterium CG10_big_fil_rev_8_21_14_0_10_37_14 TaxID=1974561 RepID=A0A2M6WSI8_9BACT|nr:glycosyltransferase family 4 protein [Candidatus Falkowbacteria bacterium]PIT95777.1 MAG: hypothetical protein COT94_04290 [Candidatus Falkowbacteria bacterium CG10_big_fil_rev_8_21_14_0_10_37_14]
MIKQSKNDRRRIGIDARFYGSIGKGLGRYTQETVDQVIRLDPHNDYVIFLRSENWEDFKINQSNVKKVLADVAWYGLAEQIVMPYLIAKEKLDLIHFPHFNVPLLCQTAFVVTIHDLILFHYPTQRASTLSPVLYWLKNYAYRQIINRAVKKAKKIITVSEFTKQDLITSLLIPADKIKVIYEGVASLQSSETVNYSKVLEKYGITEPYWLYVGNAYPHKNLETLIKVFADFCKIESEAKLVLVGKEDYFYKRLKASASEMQLWHDQPVTNNSVIFAGFVPDAVLAYLYKHAEAYVFPSLYEGFGLPPLEAMSMGTPVLSSERSSLPEILDTAAMYFNPKQPQTILKAMLDLYKDQFLREKMIKLGRERIKKFNWIDSGAETLKVYKQVL